MESISNALLSLYQGTESRDSWLTACLQGAWPRLVGEQLARVSRPVSLTKAELTVEVADESWLSALAGMKAEILGRVRDVAGSEVRRLSFRNQTVRESVIQAPHSPAAEE